MYFSVLGILLEANNPLLTPLNTPTYQTILNLFMFPHRCCVIISCRYVIPDLYVGGPSSQSIHQMKIIVSPIHFKVKELIIDNSFPYC